MYKIGGSVLETTTSKGHIRARRILLRLDLKTMPTDKIREQAYES